MSEDMPYIGKRKTPVAYQHALLIAEGWLLAAAAARRVVTYGEINTAVQRATGHQFGFSAYGPFLEDLVRQTFQKYGVILSALVVKSDTLLPGEGFYPLAVDLGKAKADEAEAEVAVSLRAEVWRKLSL